MALNVLDVLSLVHAPGNVTFGLLVAGRLVGASVNRALLCPKLNAMPLDVLVARRLVRRPEPSMALGLTVDSGPVRHPGILTARDALERYARAFDEISDAQDACYSARSFVRWVRLEATAPRADNRKRSR